MLLILSPAKTLDENCTIPKATLTEPEFFSDAQSLTAQLKTFSEAQLGSLMDISPKLAALNASRYASFPKSLNEKNSRPAMFQFRGDVYEGFDIDSLPAAALPELQKRVRILSGLYGLLRPLDRMYPYRLEMGTALQNPRGKDLYAFWGTRLSEALNRAAEAANTDILLNLASGEYRKAVARKPLKLQEITVHFKEQKGNTLQVLGLFAKRARGRMARFVVEQQIATPKALQAFAEDGYRFDAALSDSANFTFVRPHPPAKKTA
jgi:cytoplasmic iron level regulating protein YaaA (DUF328/UPF0246 family)